jgi:PleD family two-component response regulator
VVTVTAGWAEYVPNTEISLDALLDAADRHLYAEKAAEAARPGH